MKMRKDPRLIELERDLQREGRLKRTNFVRTTGYAIRKGVEKYAPAPRSKGRRRTVRTGGLRPTGSSIRNINSRMWGL
jgi:hypothetical protein